jgi:hypothetical protein
MSSAIPLFIAFGICVVGLLIDRRGHRRLASIFFGAGFGLFVLTLGVAILKNADVFLSTSRP